MKTFDFIQATISHDLKDPHPKSLEPDCLSPLAGNYDTVSRRGRHRAGVDKNKESLFPSPFHPLLAREKRFLGYL